eukprot:4923908-Prymnesium_polylepis.1
MASAMPAMSTQTYVDPNIHKADLIQRPLQVLGICTLVVFVSACLKTLVWCGSGEEAGSGETPFASEVTFFVILIIASAISTAFSWCEIRAVKTSMQKLVESYEGKLHGKTAFTLNDPTFGVSSAKGLTEALAASSISELTVCGQTPGEGAAALLKAMAGKVALKRLSVNIKLPDGKGISTFLAKSNSLCELE